MPTSHWHGRQRHGVVHVIYLTRLDGSELVVNADLIETVEHTADTLITLTDSKKLIVSTPVEEVIDRIIAYRQRIVRGPLRVFDEPHPQTGESNLREMARGPRPIGPAHARHEV
jgi:flagellar protein FlbD